MVNLDADIRNADWTKWRTNDLPRMTTRAELESVIRDIPHWLRDLPSANPSAVQSVWHLLTEEEKLAYEDRELDEGQRLVGLVDGGSAVLSLRANETDESARAAVAAAVASAFKEAGSRFAADASVDDIERGIAGIGDSLLEGLKDDYVPAVERLASAWESVAIREYGAARKVALRSSARKLAPSPSAAARRYALSRALRLVDDLSSTARSAARQILDRDDLQARTRVRRLQAVIGMNERQSQSFMRAMSELEEARGKTVALGSFATVRVPEGGLSFDEITAAGDRYAKYLVAQRAELIARTEGTSIREETRRNTWERIAEDGENPRFKWLTDGESCAQCEALDGTTIGIGEEYAPGISTPPAHPGCDCRQSVSL